MEDQYLYLLVNILSFAVPFIASFERKAIHFIADAKYIFLALVTMSTFFILWDIWFAAEGIWGWNDRYILGWVWKNLPLEEYMFFFLIGYCCLFLYVIMNYLIKIKNIENLARKIFLFIAIINLLVAILHYSKAYTFWAMGLNGLAIIIFYLSFHWFSFQKFLLGYLFSIIPFTLVNGILTGGFTDEPVVWYNNNENLNMRLGTIPIEDSQYMMLMMLITVGVYEYSKKQKDG